MIGRSVGLLAILAPAFAQQTWVWLGGNTTRDADGVDPPAQNVFSSEYWPSARLGAQGGLNPVTGDLVVYGGEQYDYVQRRDRLLCDMWLWNRTTRQWGIISGLTAGLTESSTSPVHPGVKSQGAGAFDKEGNLVVFGGRRSIATPPFGQSVFRYNFSDGTWSSLWTPGSPTNISSVYYLKDGDKRGYFDSSNQPGSRTVHCNALDREKNILYVWGGVGWTSPYPFNFADLWAFNLTSRMWAFVGGRWNRSDPTFYDNAYGPLRAFGPTYSPAPRKGHACYFDQQRKRLYVTSGLEYYARNDIWAFDPIYDEANRQILGDFAWMGGDSTMRPSQSMSNSPGQFSLTNNPGAMYHPGFVYDPDIQRFYFFGGAKHTSGDTNLLWIYREDNNQYAWIGDPNQRAEPYPGGITGSYGTLGVKSFSNLPPVRRHAVFDKDPLPGSSDLYVFGGYVLSLDGTGTFTGRYNDLWCYGKFCGKTPCSRTTYADEEGNCLACPFNATVQYARHFLDAKGCAVNGTSIADVPELWAIFTYRPAPPPPSPVSPTVSTQTVAGESGNPTGESAAIPGFVLYASVGGGVGLIAVGLASVFIVRRRRQKKVAKESESNDPLQMRKSSTASSAMTGMAGPIVYPSLQRQLGANHATMYAHPGQFPMQQQHRLSGSAYASTGMHGYMMSLPRNAAAPVPWKSSTFDTNPPAGVTGTLASTSGGMNPAFSQQDAAETRGIVPNRVVMGTTPKTYEFTAATQMNGMTFTLAPTQDVFFDERQ